MRAGNGAGGADVDVDVQSFGIGYAVAVMAGLIPLMLGWAIKLLMSIIGR